MLLVVLLLGTIAPTAGALLQATAADRRGFGLGFGQTIVDNVRLWFCEGEPTGSRMFYGYFPEKDLVIVVAVNSAGAAMVARRQLGGAVWLEKGA